MAQPARKPLNTYHHGDLRDALVHAALREAEQGGPEAISLKALAKKLGVSQPAPYRHFADREALLSAVTAEAFRQFSAMLREQISKPSKRSKLSRFAQAARPPPVVPCGPRWEARQGSESGYSYCTSFVTRRRSRVSVGMPNNLIVIISQYGEQDRPDDSLTSSRGAWC